MWAFPLGAAAVSAVFAAQLLRQWDERRRPNLLAWAVALAMFALASLAAALGMLGVWTEAWFRVYYLFGAILNVPVLGLGTLYLLGPRRLAHFCAALVAVASVLAAVAVFTADVHVPALAVEGIPSGKEVMSGGVRALSRYYSYAGALVVIGGALWSAWKLSRGRTQLLRRLMVANLLIAAGTFVVAVGSAFARYGEGSVFAISLLGGVSLMYAGFVKTRPRRDVSSLVGERSVGG